MMEHYKLVEVWRVYNQEKIEYSWKKKGAWPIKASRIDFALISAGLDQCVKLIDYISSVFTDHRAIYLVIDVYPFQRGVGYWKFNCKYLQNNEFVEKMKEELQLTITSSNEKSPLDRWELIKKRVKEFSVQYSKKNISEEKLILAQLLETVNEYESRLPLNREEDELMEKTKLDLEEKTLSRIQGVMFRSKVKWYEEGEKNTKYFFSLEKARYNAKTCYKLIAEDGTELEDQQKIIEEEFRFYNDLYDQDKDVSFNMLNTFGIKVSEECRLQQEEQITLEELGHAIKQMSNNKTPGEDGIPIDFYKVFWAQLKEVFYSMVMECYNIGKMHRTTRRGVLNLIPKPSKDSRYIKNLRPITLLNSDYKAIEKVIANKMMPALQEIIHPDQRGFEKNRRISVNIRKMLDIMHQAEVEDLEAVVLSLDFVKCFDKCSFSILHGSLEFFGFGQIVRDWTRILYEDFTVRIQNNGNFSESISIKKGVHQGGCCSSVYFLVIAEILALALRSNDEIEGITLKDIRNLLNQFADDMGRIFDIH